MDTETGVGEGRRGPEETRAGQTQTVTVCDSRLTMVMDQCILAPKECPSSSGMKAREQVAAEDTYQHCSDFIRQSPLRNTSPSLLPGNVLPHVGFWGFWEEGCCKGEGLVQCPSGVSVRADSTTVLLPWVWAPSPTPTCTWGSRLSLRAGADRQLSYRRGPRAAIHCQTQHPAGSSVQGHKTPEGEQAQHWARAQDTDTPEGPSRALCKGARHRHLTVSQERGANNSA